MCLAILVIAAAAVIGFDGGTLLSYGTPRVVSSRRAGGAVLRCDPLCSPTVSGPAGGRFAFVATSQPLTPPTSERRRKTFCGFCHTATVTACLGLPSRFETCVADDANDYGDGRRSGIGAIAAGYPSSVASRRTGRSGDARDDCGGDERGAVPSASPRRQRPEEGAVLAFLRFSPLVGGPSFLPLHVEVVLAIAEETSSSSSSSSASSFLELHRFDFLPANPTDPSTLVRLATLRSVTGRVRYRRLALGCDWESEFQDEKRSGDTNIVDAVASMGQGQQGRGLVSQGAGADDENGASAVKEDGESAKIDDERGLSLVWPIGSTVASSLRVGGDEEGPVDLMQGVVISSAVDFSDRYRSTDGRELRVLFGKNCVSFAIDLLRHINDRHGMQTPVVQR